MMKVAVKDANILIDLVNGDLLLPCLNLPYEFLTTEAVLLQLEQETQWEAVKPFVATGVIHIATLSAEEQESIAADPLMTKLDFVDLGVMYVARREQAILLTGDLDLRKESAKAGVGVHGLLWILDQLIESNQLSPKEAAKRLRMICAKAHSCLQPNARLGCTAGDPEFSFSVWRGASVKASDSSKSSRSRRQGSCLNR